MRVAHLSTTHCPDDVRVVHKECRSLAELGHEVTVILPGREVPADPVDVRFDLVAKPSARLQRMTLTALMVFLRAWRMRADVYHFHSPELIPWMFLLLLRGRPIVYDVHEDFSTGIRRAIYLPYWLAATCAFGLRVLEYLATRCFTVVIAEKYYVEIFPNGVELLNYPRVEDFPELAVHEVPEADSTAPVIVYAGSLVRQRGALNYADLAKAMPEVRVRTVGVVSSKLAREMRERAGDAANLEIVGVSRWLCYGEILEAYRAKPILGLAIFPDSDHYRRKELTKFFEYMAAGIPVVCSDFPVWRKLIERHGVGVCVDPEDLASAAATIRELIADRSRRQAMADRGRALVLERFNWDLEAARLDHLYVSLVADRTTVPARHPNSI
ncbi:glycosyltransferase [Geminicoccus flavidas]|uniref:glycosyltransferase n=1 Tax=Geminicoccus flavidas TaxID=2506407 RepID=UPI00210387BB|nr:glycosyltransferase [Geminicoccus flavidas]